MRFSVAGLIACFVLALMQSPAGAAQISVTTTLDDYGGDAGVCSLREAVRSAQNGVAFNGCSTGGSSDQILLPEGVYVLSREGIDDSNTSGDIDIKLAGDLKIMPENPEDKVAIDGNGTDRVIDVDSAGTTGIANLTIRGGLADQGGGLRATTISGNINLEGVTISGNAANDSGGGLVVDSVNALVSITNSTISGNKANGNGGGIYATEDSDIAVRGSTISNNQADSNGDGDGNAGGVFAILANSVSFTNVLMAGNLDLSQDAIDQVTDCSTNPSFFPRFVLSTQPLGSGTCLTGADPGSNNVVVDAGLAPLADNGGQTQTHALLPGSPAIDAGGTAAPDACEAADQRGIARTTGRCDIGSFEFVAPPPVATCLDEPTRTGCPLGPIKNPTATTATFDGRRLHVRLKCPARFKPKCLSRSMPVTLSSNKGRPMAMKQAKRIIGSNKWLNVTYLIKPAFRNKVKAMTRSSKKLLHTRQVIRSKKIGSRKNPKASTVFRTYGVRVQG